MAQDITICTMGYLWVYLSAGHSAAAFPRSGAVWADAAHASTREHHGAWRAKGSLQESVLFFFFFFFYSHKEQFGIPAFLQVSILEVTAASGWRGVWHQTRVRGKEMPAHRL